MGQNADECGPDTDVTADFRQDLIEAYNENSTDTSEKFNTNNPGEDQMTYLLKLNKNITLRELMKIGKMHY